MPQKKMLVQWEDGSNLSKSRKKPGQYSSLTRADGTNQLGHVTLSDIEDDEVEDDAVIYAPPVYATCEDASPPSVLTAEEREELAQLLADVITILAVRAAPHVKRLWDNKAAPALRSARDKTASWLAEIRQQARQGVHLGFRDGDSDGADLVTSVQAASDDASRDMTTALEARLPSMSSAEARQRLAVALSAMAVRDWAKTVGDKQLGILLNSRIEDADGARVGQNSLQSLTPEEIERCVHQLTTNPALFDELMAVLVHGQTSTVEPQSALPGHHTRKRLGYAARDLNLERSRLHPF